MGEEEWAWNVNSKFRAHFFGPREKYSLPEHVPSLGCVPIDPKLNSPSGGAYSIRLLII